MLDAASGRKVQVAQAFMPAIKRAKMCTASAAEVLRLPIPAEAVNNGDHRE
jgi:hypothetical protein